MRDTWSRDTQGALGQPHARSRWLHLYINGIYWGIYQIEERAEATFAAKKPLVVWLRFVITPAESRCHSKVNGVVPPATTTLKVTNSPAATD